MGTALLIAWVTAAAASPCDADGASTVERWDVLDEAERAVIELDLDGAREALTTLERSLGCGRVVEAELLGRMWLLEGALSTFQGDRQSADEAWTAAGRVSPGRWLEDLGGQLRQDYEAALGATLAQPSVVRVEPAPPPGWTFALNGREADLPASVPAGLHVVQVGPSPDRIVVGRVILTHANAPSVIGLEEGDLEAGAQQVEAAPLASKAIPTPKPAEPSAARVRRPEPTRSLRPWLALGTTGAVGQPLTTPDDGDEPGIKVVVPVEGGLVVRGGAGWVRAAATVAPLLGGRFLWSDGERVYGSPVAVGGHVAGGASLGVVEPGLLGGVAWPGRIVLHGVVGVRPVDSPVRVELRLGTHLATERRPEPAGGLALSLAL